MFTEIYKNYIIDNAKDKNEENICDNSAEPNAYLNDAHFHNR